MARTAAHAIIDHLVAEGTRYLFVGPPTNHQFAFLDALYDRQSEITPILVRHEAMLPWMAEGWFRATGEPGVFHVGAGPALANTVIGCMTAYTCCSGVVGISGNVNSEFVGRNGMQEIQGKTFSEGHRILEPVLKKYWHVPYARKMPEVMSQAFAAATTGRPGPVLVDVPMDVFEGDCDAPSLPPARHRPKGRPMGDRAVVSKALELIRSAKAPVLLCGGGVIQARAGGLATKLAEALGLPVVTSYTGKGAIPDDHELAAGPVGAMGVPGAMALTKEADVIVALGHRFSEHSTSGWEVGLPYDFSKQKLIQVDIEPLDVGRYFPVEVGIVGDIGAVLQQWLDLAGGGREKAPLSERAKSVKARRNADRARVDTAVAAKSGPIRPERLVAELRRALPRDGYVLPDAGNNGNYFNTLWDVFEEGTYIADRGSAAMGYAPAAALGVKLARPDKQVVVVTGDGCMTQVNWVLATAVEYGIAVKFIVLNDSALGGCLAAQKGLFANRVICTQFEKRNANTYDQDFSALAKAYQMEAERVEKPGDIAAALARALATDGPYLIDIPVDRDARPLGVGRMRLSNKPR